jgi:hypothetical protein
MFQAQITRAAGIHILSIGVGDWANLDVLTSYSSYPGVRNTLTAASYGVMFQLIDPIILTICSGKQA